MTGVFPTSVVLHIDMPHRRFNCPPMLFNLTGLALAVTRLTAQREKYRSWLDAVGTSIAVRQKLMRHSDIRTTLNIYGDVVTNEMEQAHSKVVGLALSRA